MYRDVVLVNTNNSRFNMNSNFLLTFLKKNDIP